MEKWKRVFESPTPLKRGTAKPCGGKAMIGARRGFHTVRHGKKTIISPKPTIFAHSKAAPMNFESITPEYLCQHGISPDGLLFSANHLPYNPRLKELSRNMRRYGEKSEALPWRIYFVFNLLTI